jgi:excisionase family DNA binding protein
MEKRGFRVTEAAAYTGRPRTAIYEALRSGELRSYKVGGARLLLREDLDRWLDFLTTTPDVSLDRRTG